MDLAIYAHSWDLRALGAQGGLPRLCDLGFGEIALAVSYHAGRWLTPWHPDGLVRFLEDGTVHYRPRGDYGALAPQVAREVRDGEPSPLEWLCAQAGRVGLRTRAWTVLTHNSRLGELHPECCVENACGDRYAYALCPANPAVQQYMAAMLQDLAAHAGLQTIELEALGWLGHRHNSHHDKSSFATGQRADFLLSACFCPACRRGMAALRYEQGVIGDDHVAALRQSLAAALRRHFTDGDCMQPAAAKVDQKLLLQQLRAEHGERVVAILGHRIHTVLRLLAGQQSLRLSGVRLAVQTHYDALRGNAALPLAALGHAVDEAVLTAHAESPAGVRAALPHLVAARGQGLEPPRTAATWPTLRLAIHPRAPQFTTDDDLRAVKELCQQHDVGALSIYHLGLLPWRTIERVAKVLSA